MQEHTLRFGHATTIALDRHARSVTLAALDLATGETRAGRLTDCPSAELIVDWAKWATRPLRFAYESGPCGFQLAREIRSMGIDCDVMAVTSMPRGTEPKRPRDDGRDAQSPLEAVTAPNSRCRAACVPSEESGAARGLCRAYHDMAPATKRPRMQFSAMLLRHGLVWSERTDKGDPGPTWTRDCIRWAKSTRLPEEAESQTLKFCLKAVLDGLDRCEELGRACPGLSASDRLRPYVDAPARLKGVDRMAAPACVATTGDLSRLRNGRSVSKHLGLTPARHDGGEEAGGNGGTAKAGDTTVRKAAIEGPASLPNSDKSQKWLPRGCGASAAVEAEACLCNARNAGRHGSPAKAGRRPNVAKVAVASEPVRQVWVLGSVVRRELGEGWPRGIP